MLNKQTENQLGAGMDTNYENRRSEAMSGAHSAAAGEQPRLAGARPAGARGVLRLVHSDHRPQAAFLPRAEPAGIGQHRQKFDFHRTGNSWAWTSSPSISLEASDCRIWKRGTAKPVLIAAIASGKGPKEQAGAGPALAVPALLNILDEDMAGYLESDRLAALLRGAVGEVQLLIERQANQSGRPIGDYGAALLAVIMTDTGGVIGRIGGGGALIQEGNGAWCPVPFPAGASTANKAQCLTDADAFAAFQIAELSSTPRRLSLHSTGIEGVRT